MNAHNALWRYTYDINHENNVTKKNNLFHFLNAKTIITKLIIYIYNFLKCIKWYWKFHGAFH